MKPQTNSPGPRVRRLTAAALVLTLSSLVAAIDAEGGVIATDDPPSTAYAALWLQGEGEARISSTSSLTGLLADNAVFEHQGFQLIDLEIAGQDEERRFVGLWHERPPAAECPGGAHVAVDLTVSGLSAKVAAELGADYRLADLEVYPTAGVDELLAAAVFHRSPLRREYRVGVTEAELLEARGELEPAHRMIDLEMTGSPGAIRYSAVWIEQGATPAPVIGVAQDWRALAGVGGGLSAWRHPADMELARLGEDQAWLAAGLFTGRSVPEIVLFPASWSEIEDRLETGYAEPVPPGTGDWLLSDIEILWLSAGEVDEASLPLAHDGPMIPPEGED
jgi:hypothetical protein